MAPSGQFERHRQATAVGRERVITKDRFRPVRVVRPRVKPTFTILALHQVGVVLVRVTEFARSGHGPGCISERLGSNVVSRLEAARCPEAYQQYRGSCPRLASLGAYIRLSARLCMLLPT